MSTLYHGSGRVMDIPDIKFPGPRDNCDFGRGFYLTENKQTAEEWVCETDNPTINVYNFTEGSANILRLADGDWIRVIIGFRLKKYKVQFKSPVVYGLIADDRMVQALTYFMDGVIGDKKLMAALDYCKLGSQYAFREPVDGLSFVNSYPLKSMELQKAYQRKQNRYAAMESGLKDIYRRALSGEEFLEDYIGRGDFIEP